MPALPRSPPMSDTAYLILVILLSGAIGYVVGHVHALMSCHKRLGRP